MSEFAPMDILGKKFTRKLRGYDEFAVHEYLTELARAMEGMKDLDAAFIYWSSYEPQGFSVVPDVRWPAGRRYWI